MKRKVALWAMVALLLWLPAGCAETSGQGEGQNKVRQPTTLKEASEQGDGQNEVQRPTALKLGANGKKIAFVSDQGGNLDISVMNADGQTRLTNSAEDEYAPVWSPDGKKIAFLRLHPSADSRYAVDYRTDIYVMNADGSDETRLGDEPLDVDALVFSPDGKKIAFSTEVSAREPYGPSGSNIYVMNADGTKLTNLTNNAGGAFAPAWSPDGKKVAYLSRAYVSDLERQHRTEPIAEDSGSFSYDASDVYVMNANGTGYAPLTKTAGEEEARPTWSPDGKKIAFVNDLDISVMNADGSDWTSIAFAAEDEYAPAWSPDGKKIAFVRKHPAGNVDIYVTNADGIGKVRLTNSSGYGVSGFAWSPDGKKIAFIRGSSIYLVEADGTSETLLTSNVCAGCGIAWGKAWHFSREG